MWAGTVGARPRRYAVAVLASAAFWLLAPTPVSAHPYLVQTVPGPGVILRSPPQTIELGFTERVVLEGSSLRLEDRRGRPVDLGPLRQPKGGPGLAADVRGTMGAAVYRVRWVVLGDDGHTTSGDFPFGLAAPDGSPPPGAERLAATGGPADQASPADGPLRVGLRWVGLLGATLLLGGAVLSTRIRGALGAGAEAAFSARWSLLARLGWVLALAGSTAAVVGAAGAGRGPARLSIALATTTGVLALARLAGVVLSGLPAVFLRPGRRRDELTAVAGAIFLGAEAVSGHVTALTGGRLLAVLAQLAHLGAAGVWVGGLATLAFTIAGVAAPDRPAAWRAALSSFAPVAGASAAVVVATGTVAAVREVHYRYFLRWSAYGQVLLVKLALVASMLVLGAMVGRSVRRRRPAGARPIMERSPGLLRWEAALGVAVLVLAATLAGVAQGRGQPLPAQRGSVLAGPAFANVVVGDGLARLALAPAAPGRNRLTMLMAGAEESGKPQEPTAPKGSTGLGAVEISLTCSCARGPVRTHLAQGSGVWYADVELPAPGVWRASLTVDGRPGLAPVALRVAEEGAPGAPPVVIAAPGDLSGPEGRRCRSFQLGMLLALGFLNADGGVAGRKVVLDVVDDGGNPTRSRALAERQIRAGADLGAPCGPGAGAAAGVFGRERPVVLGDARAPLVAGNRIFRLAADPYAEGWAMGRTVATSGFVGRSNAPRRVSVVADDGDPTTDRAVEGLRAALALDPDVARAAERRPSENVADVEVSVLRHRPGTPLLPVVLEATRAERYVAAFLRSETDETGRALDQMNDEEIAGVGAILVPTAGFDEHFYRASKLGRRGSLSVLGEVAPDSGESLLYTRLAVAIYPGEQPTIDGLRGYMAGKAIASGLRGGTSSDEVARRLKFLGPFSDGVASGWSPAAPAAGSWRFFLYKGSFIASGLLPGAPPEPGRFFPQGGAWSRIATANVGLCGPQERFGGPAPGCKPAEKKRAATR